ncbi:DUF6766 family protein [Luteolibacter sp. Populi]|uniref:DUF6766 family protein n=1 Tax=Luteolibacter sp. Populi TaxID=3230487 RepID=UPI003465B9D6
MKFLRDNGLSLVLAGLFLLFWAGQAVMGFKVHEADARLHQREPGSFGEYLGSGHFWQATGENWESEFLQMGAYVILTTFFYQRGSAESLDPDEAEKEKAENARAKRTSSWVYRNSLSLAMLALFLAAFALHTAGGLAEWNDERAEHGEAAESLLAFWSDPEFWFQSFQNWQSEFLAVLAIVMLSIFLRQHGSPESKKVTDPNSKTGA